MPTEPNGDTKIACDLVRTAASEDRLVVLVGAGASRPGPGNLPTWPELAQKMCDFVEMLQKPRAELMRDEAGKGKFLEVGELFERSDGPPRDRADFFRRLFDVPMSRITEAHFRLSR